MHVRVRVLVRGVRERMLLVHRKEERSGVASLRASGQGCADKLVS